MKKLCLICWIFLVVFNDTHGQPIVDKLKTAVITLEKDPQMRHGLLGFYVAEAKTGKMIFEVNGQIGLAPASTQKIITSATGFELLGNDFRFKTYIRYDKEIVNKKLTGDLYILGKGDPTLGSWRWEETTEEAVLNNISEILQKRNIFQVEGDIIIDDLSYTLQPVPDGWIWQDIGNYYGAGCWGLNWRENQYDLILQSGKSVGGPTAVLKTKPELADFQLVNLITSGKVNSGDNGYIYAAPFSGFGFTMGTIPPGEKAFTISGAMPRPALQFAKSLEQKLKAKGIAVSGKVKLHSDTTKNYSLNQTGMHALDSISSPSWDSVNYWFMRKSINLYGEALGKVLVSQKKKVNITTDEGIEIIRDFWVAHGLEKTALNIIDGSGLSPQNRVTTHSLVKVLQFAKTRPWFQSFYHSLPEYNGMKIKSGSISGARSFAGYHTSSVGKEYIFAIIVNNYNGSSGEMVKKMYKVLDVLK